MKGFFGSLAGICLINLVPYIMTLFMLMSKSDSLIYSIFSLIQSLFSIPTSLIGFALQYDLGEVWWIILNSIVLLVSIVIVIKE